MWNRSIFKWVGGGALGTLAVFWTLSITKLIENWGLDQWLTHVLQGDWWKFIFSPWFTHPVVLLIGVVFGVFYTVFTTEKEKRVDPKREARVAEATKQSAIVAIGDRMLHLGNEMNEWCREKVPFDVDLAARIRSLKATMKKASLNLPISKPEHRTEEVHNKFVSDFFVAVGRLLNDGHFKDAKELATKANDYHLRK